MFFFSPIHKSVQGEYTLVSNSTLTQNIEQFIFEGIAQFQEFSERLRPFCTDILTILKHSPSKKNHSINNKED